MDSGEAVPVAVVTGAASGIGSYVAHELTDAGWAVAGLDLNEAQGLAASYTVDMHDADAVLRVVDQVTKRLGPIRAAVSAAGHYEMTPVSEIDHDQWNRMLRVHLGGFINLTRAVAPSMRAGGGGAIVAIASELAIGGGDRDSHYGAAKGAVLGAVRSVALEMIGDGIRVNAVAPGPTDTPLLAHDSPWREDGFLATLPSRRLATPAEVSATVRFLVERGTFCVGEVFGPNSGAVI
ncbi:SDR family NAD(P)-dependent oxidoreductase [Pseudactinotalea sp. Z1739]|uniref:SDR family NAD(P)-dependent oxidoreductase n=1 Tax=Pseudactinotalea sp. Z1739 TaxID=3413028 RepID=UPI003C7ABF5B